MKPAVKNTGRRKMNLEPLLKKVLMEKVDDKPAILRILQKLTDMALDGDLKAAELLIDRAYGKAKQQTPLSGRPLGVVAIQYVLPDNGNNNKAYAEAAPGVGSFEVLQ